jgi:hypothetical protein
MGDARLSLPIRSPAGRGAYSPNLGFSYSSAAGNDWLGVGWSVSMSRIEIDSRWGVPTYADGEEVRYLLDGGQLVPTLDSDGPACSDGSTAHRYHTRAEGAFAHILRCGSNPSNYHWEVIDRNGTTFVYGDTASSAGNASVKSTKARPAACGASCPGIYRWNLRTVTDTHGNTTTYSYFVDDIAGAEPGREVYPQTVSYTSHPSLAAAYSIEFALDSSNRPDQIISGRGGFKEQTRRLLRWVRVKYGTQIIRQYVLTYSHGMYDKSVLTSIRMYGEGGCAATTNSFTLPTCGGLVDEHTFSYVNNSQMMGFSAPQTWTVAGTHPGDPAINAGDDRTSSGRLSLGFPLPEVSALGSFGVTGSWGDRTETAGMFDLNGDGLADQVIYDEHNVPVPELNGGEIGTTGSGLFGVAAQSPTKPMPAMGFENHSSWGVDARVGFQSDGFGASASYTDATSRAKQAVLDVDGDGYVDYVDATAPAASAVMLSSPGSDGQQFTANPYGVLSTVNPGLDSLLAGMNQHIKDRAIPADPIVRWVAPFTGTIDLAATAQIGGVGGSDGVTVLVYQNETLLGSGPLSGPQDPPFEFEMAPLSVTAGDSIYLVVKTGSDDGASSTVLKEMVEAYMTPEYLSACANATCLDPSPLSSEPGALDPMNAPVTSFDSETDFRAVATRPIILSATGKIEVHGSFNKLKSAADIQFCLERFSKDASTTDVPCANVPTGDIVWPLSGHSVTVTQTQVFTQGQSINRIGFGVHAGDRLVLRAESDYSVDPGTFTFVPDAGGHTLVYSQACETGDSDPDCNQTTDPDLLTSVKPDARAIASKPEEDRSLVG